MNGWNVLQRARDEGFNPADATTSSPFPISHLYTALSRPAIRSYLGIAESTGQVVKQDSIPGDKAANLLQLMDWLYGQRSKGTSSLIRTQNPDLGVLVRVIASEVALEELVANRDLDAAEDLLTPSNEKFEILVRQAARGCELALASAKDYDGTPTLLEIVNNMGRTVLALRTSMEAKKTDPLASFAHETPKA